MRDYAIGLLVAFFETIAATLTAYSALDVTAFLRAFHSRDTTFDPGLPGLVRK